MATVRASQQGDQPLDDISKKILGAKGFGPTAWRDEDAEPLQEKMTGLLARVEEYGMSQNDGALILGICRHFDAGAFATVARRRAGTWGILRPLADKVVEHEGWAIIWFESAQNAARLSQQLVYVVAEHEIRMLLMKDIVAKNNLTTTQRVLEEQQEFLVDVAREAMRGYWKDILLRMGGNNERR